MSGKAISDEQFKKLLKKEYPIYVAVSKLTEDPEDRHRISIIKARAKHTVGVGPKVKGRYEPKRKYICPRIMKILYNQLIKDILAKKPERTIEKLEKLHEEGKI